MKLVSAEEMRRIDEATIRHRGVAEGELMERAGRAVAREVMERFQPHSVAIVAGKGNNGGDGFVAARAFRERGVEVALFALFDPAEARGAAKAALERLPPEIRLVHCQSARELRAALIQADVVVDAILGTGLRGIVTGFLAEAIEAINASQTNVVSIDVPSGLLAGVQQSGGPVVQASVTITIGLPKLGLVLGAGRARAGIVSIADIGFPLDLLNDAAISMNLLTIEEMRAALPRRDPSGHKGTFGKALILAGSEGMTGAAVLCARAAGRSGAGLVYSAYPAPLGAIMESHLIEPVKRPLPGRAKWFANEHAAAALKLTGEMDAVALGPGLGQRPATAAFVRKIAFGAEKPIVIDADGLNLLARDLKPLAARRAPTVLTPHPGEAARLLGCTAEDVNANRSEACLNLARELNAVIVLKGAQTILTAPDGQRYANPTGNSGLAKGGSGDVLTGLIAGLLAQGAGALAAAQVGVFLHGIAADRAARKHGVRALIPSDLIDYLGEAFMQIEKGGS